MIPTKYHFCISPSWESGQDVSTRFGPQQTGGAIIQHVRPVDLQASMAQGATILARWATLLAEEDHPENDAYQAEAQRWQGVADDFTAKTRLMWHNGWFRDYDSVANEWSAEQDAMHLTPPSSAVWQARGISNNCARRWRNLPAIIPTGDRSVGPPF